MGEMRSCPAIRAAMRDVQMESSVTPRRKEGRCSAACIAPRCPHPQGLRRRHPRSERSWKTPAQLWLEGSGDPRYRSAPEPRSSPETSWTIRRRLSSGRPDDLGIPYFLGGSCQHPPRQPRFTRMRIVAELSPAPSPAQPCGHLYATPNPSHAPSPARELQRHPPATAFK